MRFNFLVALLLSLQLAAATYLQASAQDGLGQSDWQTPGNTDQSASTEQLGQSNWQTPGSSEQEVPNNQPTAQVSDSCSYNSAPGLKGAVSQNEANSELNLQAASTPITTSPNAAVVQKSQNNNGSNASAVALNGIGAALGGLARGVAYSGMMSPYGMMGGMGMMSPYGMMNPMGMMGGMGMMSPYGMMNPMGMMGGGMSPAASGATAAIQGATTAAGTIGGMLIERRMMNSMLSHMYPRFPL